MQQSQQGQASGELAARFERVIKVLKGLIDTEAALVPAFNESIDGKAGVFGDALFLRGMAQLAFEKEMPTMEALIITLKDNCYSDPLWPTDGADDVEVLRSIWHSIYDNAKDGKSFAPEDLDVARNLYSALERAREKLTGVQLSTIDLNGVPQPSWNRIKGVLTFDNQTIRTISCIGKAKNVVMVLDTFEEEEWPVRIDSPLPSSNSQKHHATIYSLNTNLDRIKFKSDGEGEGFIWEAV